MATPSESLPFQLTLQRAGRDPHEIPVHLFTESTDELLSGRVVGAELREATPYRLFFTANVEARLYMDILEVLPIRDARIEMDSQDVPFVRPDARGIDLFVDDYIPWIPGLYHIRVIADGRTYYSSVKVRPKLLNDHQLEALRQEILRDARHMALQLVRSSVDEADHGSPEASYEWDRLDDLLPLSRRLTAAALDLKERPNFKIVKRYERAPLGVAVQMDPRVVRHTLTRPLPNAMVMTLRRQVSHQLPENLWLVRIVHELHAFLQDGLKRLADYQAQLRQEMADAALFLPPEVEEARRTQRQAALAAAEGRVQTVERIVHALRELAASPWFQSVQATTLHPTRPWFTHVLVQDPRYRVFLEAFHRLRSAERTVEIDPSYVWQWRQTNELYQVWTYLQLVRCIGRQGYRLSSGDMAHPGPDGSVYLRALQPGGHIDFHRADTRLRLVYDMALPHRADHTTPDQPLYATQRHNRPDGILHVYRRDVYCGSIVFDAKYRPVRNFWNFDVPEHNRPKAMDQLSAYEGTLKSQYLYGKRNARQKPVYEVWAIHPSGRDAVEDIPDYGVKLLRLTPGERNEHLTEILRRAIHGILEGLPEPVR
ncbi:MAG: hypothetical protein IRZ10_11805 [Thermoflavifilum sp.]|nr:hypothetical protein [Thermoflavifilum sp.]MCL6515084.1 hypothetical protein [Alicyclobacillus sp.]